MNKIISLLFVVLISLSVTARNNFSQNDASGHSIGITIGPSWALTDLGGGGRSNPFLRDLDLKSTKFGIGAFYRYTINEWVAVRAQFLYGMLAGSDKNVKGPNTYNGNYKGPFFRKARNADFKTHLLQIEAIAELNLKRYDPSASKGDKARWAPYLAGGFGMFYFNPFTKGTFSTQNLGTATYPVGLGGGNVYTAAEINELKQYEGEKIKLRKLGASTGSTYAPISFNLTGILGLKFNVTDKIAIFGELWYNQTFTDNLDDVNGDYPNFSSYQGLSPLQKAMTVRYYEIHNTLDPAYAYGGGSIFNPVTGEGYKRGDDDKDPGDAKGKNDQFFSAQIGVSIRLEGGGRNNGFGCGRKNAYNHKFSCPKW